MDYRYITLFAGLGILCVAVPAPPLEASPRSLQRRRHSKDVVFFAQRRDVGMTTSSRSLRLPSLIRNSWLASVALRTATNGTARMTGMRRESVCSARGRHELAEQGHPSRTRRHQCNHTLVEKA